jgi:signal transduction histidine kinase
MFAGQGPQAKARRLPMFGQSIRWRELPAARWILASALAVAAVAVFFMAPDWVVVGRPSLLALVLAISVGLLAFLQLESRVLQRDLRAARVRAVDSRDMERQRIQRDLHDSAQQRLVSVRIHLGLLADAAEDPAERARTEQLGMDLDTALAEIAAVTRDGYPQLLLLRGVAPSLRSAAFHSPVPVTIEADGFGRYPETVERNVYFCCVEALQNVVKHAGRNAKARVRLSGTPTRVVFEVEDSGVGFDPVRVKPGGGLVNLADRVGTMHGRLTVDSRPGMGTRIRGEIPLQ